MALPVVAAGLAGAIGQAVVYMFRLYAVSLIVRIFAAIGIGIFAYTYAVPEINSFIGSKFSALPEFVRQSVGAAGVDVFVTMVVSALAVRKSASLMFRRLGD